MRKNCWFLLIFILITSNSYAGLYYNESFDNTRYQKEFDDPEHILYGTMTGVCGVLLDNDPTPSMNHTFDGTILTIDPGFQKMLWNYYSPSKEVYSLRHFGADGSMLFPRSIIANQSGDMYIADTGNHRIIKLKGTFGNNGLEIVFSKTFGRKGDENGELLSPIDVGLANNMLFVLDHGNSRIQEFDADGNHIRTLGGYGSGPGQFMHPRGIAIMGGIYVADTGNGRIQRLNYHTGSFERQVGRGGAVPKDALFTDLAADHNQVYVVDEKHNQIYLFDQSLNYIDTYRGNPGSPFRELRGISIFPTEDGFYHPHKAVTVEKDRIQLFRLGMNVKRIEAVPSVFYPPSGDRKTTTLKYVLTDNGAVRLVVRDAANNIVRKIYSPEELHSLGLNEVVWDGKDDGKTTDYQTKCSGC